MVKQILARRAVVAVALVVVFVLFPQSTGAQWGGDTFYATIDIPAENEVIHRSGLVIHGWAFNCTRGGQQPVNARLVVFSASLPATAPAVVVPVRRLSALGRPDVKAAYADTCPEMSTYVGFALVPVSWEAIPTGTVTIVVEFSDNNGAVYPQRRMTLK